MREATNDFRVLLLVRRESDAAILTTMLAQDGIDGVACTSLPNLLQQMERGAGAAMLTEEIFSTGELAPLVDWLDVQPAWSDFPFILVAAEASSSVTANAVGLLKTLSNVILLDRPLSTDAVRHAAASALRARQRQYETRNTLAELSESEDALYRLNATLESRITERTAELAQVNQRLLNEIKERERTETALIQSHKMEAIGHLTGGFAHDFNNLLHVVVGNVDLIERISDDPRICHFASIAKKTAQRGTRLTGQLLAFSREQNLHLKAVDLATLIEGMQDVLKVSLGSKIGITLQLQPLTGLAIADASQIEMAILNLTLNARDAMPDGGVVTIRNEVRRATGNDLPDGCYAVISVADRGVGIPAQLLGQVFDPFFTTKAVGKGKGLGLSQVYGVARQSGGTVRIESEVGHGTRVEIWLPLAGVDDPVQPDVDQNDVDIAGNAAVRILVVEDDDDVRDYMVESLGLLGYQVDQAADGASGLAEIARSCPDLLIVDFLMPGMNGAEVVDAVSHSAPDLPVIVATGYADMQAIDRVVGSEAILRKPFEISELARTVRTALAQRH